MPDPDLSKRGKTLRRQGLTLQRRVAETYGITSHGRGVDHHLPLPDGTVLKGEVKQRAQWAQHDLIGWLENADVVWIGERYGRLPDMIVAMRKAEYDHLLALARGASMEDGLSRVQALLKTLDQELAKLGITR